MAVAAGIMETMPVPASFSADDLGHALQEALNFADARPAGSPTVFALVPTAVLARLQPDAVADDDDSVLSLVAEDGLPASTDEPLAALEEFLATASWPEPVAGAVIVAEILTLPPDTDLPHDGDPAATSMRALAAAHPHSRAARLAVGALRGGRALALLDLAVDDADPAGPRDLRTHPQLALDLQRALALTLLD